MVEKRLHPRIFGVFETLSSQRDGWYGVDILPFTRDQKGTVYVRRPKDESEKKKKKKTFEAEVTFPRGHFSRSLDTPYPPPHPPTRTRGRGRRVGTRLLIGESGTRVACVCRPLGNVRVLLRFRDERLVTGPSRHQNPTRGRSVRGRRSDSRTEEDRRTNELTPSRGSPSTVPHPSSSPVLPSLQFYTLVDLCATPDRVPLRTLVVGWSSD